MLRGQDLQNSLADEAALPLVGPDLLAGPFAHVVVDEAQELDANVPTSVRSGGVPVQRRVRSLSPIQAKGMEFDLVLLVDSGAFGPGVIGALDRYVAMTRATQRLVILE